jgi:hypothetical protein
MSEFTSRFCFCIVKLLTEMMAMVKRREKIDATKATKQTKSEFLSAPTKV